MVFERAHYDLQDRLHFIGFTADDVIALQQFWPTLEPKLEGIMDKFIAHVMAVPESERRMRGMEEKFKSSQIKHWSELFTNGISEKYLVNSSKIGRARYLAGLEPRWYIGSYAKFFNMIGEVVTKKYRRNLEKMEAVMAAIHKVLILEVDIAMTAYQKESAAQRLDFVRDLSSDLNTSLGGLVIDISAQSTRLDDAAQAVANAARLTEQLSGAAAGATVQTSASVDAAAGSGEELAGAVQIISSQAATSEHIVSQAMDKAAATQETVQKLAESAEQIGAVVRLISGIAAQTNLLALNATIEAARAGEAGRGFAVVAAEVKTLARQTAGATEEIAKQIIEIQAVAEQSCSAISSIADTIAQVNEATSAIAAGIEEQTVTARSISQNMHAASAGAAEVARNCAEVNERATDTGAASEVIVAASADIREVGDQLENRMGAFLKNLTAA